MKRVSRLGMVAAVALLLAGVSGSLCWPATAKKEPPSTGPDVRTTTSRPGVSYTATMVFRFENVTVDVILAEMSARFGFIIIKTVTITNRVTINVPRPVNADEAVRLLDDMLVPLGFGILETHTGEGADGKTVLRIGGVAEIKKANNRVFVGADPADIATSNTIITQIIPLQNLNASPVCNDLRPLMSAEADVTSNNGANCILMVDTSAHVRRFVEMVAALDQLAAQRPRPEPAAGSSLPPGMTVITGAAIASGPMAGGAYRHGIPGRGEVLAPRAAIVVPADGILQNVLVNDGAEVKAGQVIAELDAQAEQAEWAAAQARLELAKAELARIRQAGTPPGVTLAQAHVSAAQAVVASRQQAITALQIKAPFDGTLTRLDFRRGQSVRAGTTLTEVVGQEDLKLAFNFVSLPGSADLGVGTRFTFHVAGLSPDYTCEVTYVPPAGAIAQDLARRARFIGSTDRLKPGMQGTIVDVGTDNGKMGN